jgi:carbonic anhydrase
MASGKKNDSSVNFYPLNGMATMQNLEDPIQRLLTGNKRFYSNQSEGNFLPSDYNAKKHNPFAIILTCSDARICPDILFDQKIGDLFTIRVAGNVALEPELETIRFALQAFHPKIIVILAHQYCAAITSVFEQGSQSPLVPKIAEAIHNSIKGTKSIEDATNSNVLHWIETIKNDSYIQKFLQKKEIMI